MLLKIEDVAWNEAIINTVEIHSVVPSGKCRNVISMIGDVDSEWPCPRKTLIIYRKEFDRISWLLAT